jgi:hypothetical protein
LLPHNVKYVVKIKRKTFFHESKTINSRALYLIVQQHQQHQQHQ